jgi:glycosyltransferase involved in cell wall biosynthesis
MGWQDDDSTLALLYAAADVFVLPSIQENLPYAVMEAMACGTPCVAFRQGGIPDLIEHKQNGYLARPFEPADLMQGIIWVLEDDERRAELSASARRKVVLEFAIERVAKRHMKLYRELMEQK